jgi:peptidyl-prolyl cis-trans isomerase D
MISWIQKYFQQHFRTIFAVLLGATIVSFIFTIGAGSGIGPGDHKVASRPFFGHNLASEADMSVVQRETQLSSIFHQENGNPLLRIAALNIADSLNLPGPSESELKDFLKSMPVFANEKGEFDVTAYNRFQTDIRKSNQFPEALVRRVLEDDFRISRVAVLLGGPGYIQAHEVKSQLERFDTSWTLGVASIDYKSFAPAINPSEADIAKFFADKSSNYEIPPQISVRYAEFAAVNFMDQVNPSEAELKAFFDSNPARFAKVDPKADPSKPETASKPADYNDPMVRLQVERAYKLEIASRIAAKVASDFTLELYNKRLNPGTPAFEEFLVAKKIKLKDAPAFSRDEAPAELGQSPEVAEEAFKLSKDRQYSDAIAINDGSVVLFWNQNIPARQPLLTEVKAKVTADYIEGEKRKRFVDLGKSLRNQIEARLKTGDSFDKAVASAAASTGLKVDTKNFPAFTLRQRPQDLDYLAFSALENLKKGEVSEMAANTDKGMLVYAADKKAPDLTAANPMYKTFYAQLSYGTSARNSAEYLREVIDQEIAKSAPAGER